MFIMETIHFTYGAIILCIVGRSTLGKPFEEEKSFSDENKLHCMDSNEDSDRSKSNQNLLTNFYKPRSRFDGSDKYLRKPFEFDKKRSAANEITEEVGPVQKRQVGVVYQDDRPIGILQPYQRSYRFIPVNNENDVNGFSSNEQQDISYNVPNLVDVEKRETNRINLDPVQLDENYPSILTNFKIINKLDKKRNYDALTDENVRDLKATIRRLRSSNSHNNEQIEEELKNILDDMGLIEDEEIHGKKREIKGQLMNDESESSLGEEIKLNKERNKRDDSCIDSEQIGVNAKATLDHNFLNSDEKKNDVKNDILGHTSFNKREDIDESNESFRKKRQKQEATGINKENSDLVENLKDSGDIMISGNKSPLASSSEITEKESKTKDIDKRSYEGENDYEKGGDREIQNKINSLKEEVKREIEALKTSQDDDEEEDIQRKKRQVVDNLANEETDELNPAMHPSDGELKALIRKRRNIGANKNANNANLHLRAKRETKYTSSDEKQKRTSNLARDMRANVKHNEESEEGGELLGDDFSEGSISKRQVYNRDNEYDQVNNENYNLNEPFYGRDKRSGTQLNELDPYSKYLYDNYFYNKNRLKRQNLRGNDLLGKQDIRNQNVPFRPIPWKSRFRRRISDNQMNSNRPQQLSDMSDLDLFGALPKSYDGELSRYKRVKRK